MDDKRYKMPYIKVYCLFIIALNIIKLLSYSHIRQMNYFEGSR
ncbi:hypothetical protein HMPREF3232_00443 [Fannyhessea vaginae]|nr:hypothetical protein HMPREF3232_00443 [Fannyhessea vaginae]